MVIHDQGRAGGAPGGDRSKCRIHRASREVHDYTFPYPARRHRRFVSGVHKYGLERFVLKIDRHEVNNSIWGRQLPEACAFVFLCGRPVDFEHFHAGKLGHAPGAPVIAGAKYDELRRTGTDRGPHSCVDSCGPKSYHVCHSARCVEPETRFSLSGLMLYFAETLFALVVKKDSRRRIMKIRNVRETKVSHRAAEGNEVSSAARAVSLHCW